MKKCPNCDKVYRDFDQYCLVCRYKLKYIENSTIIDYPQEQHMVNTHKSTPTVTCPYCQSTDTKKITVTQRAVKTGLFGIFGAIDDAGKTYKCGNCGCKF